MSGKNEPGNELPKANSARSYAQAKIAAPTKLCPTSNNNAPKLKRRRKTRGVGGERSPTGDSRRRGQMNDHRDDNDDGEENRNSNCFLSPPTGVAAHSKRA